ncbi:hypothetical protein BLNAU_5053 [Blattamonas nauphoetae]|uniref:Uncharacterized protein n=1 Tax=Blattamonas nauphoetae TaxID=2049346 RepID=A0ABQ9Y813_9EUKA|nr:hypothetical protein BLNAU_5053 [Blattamonas nauphoetae]
MFPFHASQTIQTHAPNSDLAIIPEQEPFLNFDPISDLSFEDKSAIYCSLLGLVKEEYPFDNALQDRAAQFLKSLGPWWGNNDYAAKLVSDLVPSSAGSASGFIDSIVILLSSPHSNVVEATMSFLDPTTTRSSPAIRCRLVESDLVSKVLVIIRPYTLSISGNETIIINLNRIIDNCHELADPSFLRQLGITTAVDAFNHREVIFQKVVIPSSQFVTFLISNRNILNGGLFKSFTNLLATLIQIGPFHRPTLEYVVASPIAMTFSSCLSLVERNDALWNTLSDIDNSLESWKREGPEVTKSGKRMMQALFSEGFEDTLEQMLMHEKSANFAIHDQFEFLWI